jgi:hypothetical protein
MIFAARPTGVVVERVERAGAADPARVWSTAFAWSRRRPYRADPGSHSPDYLSGI